MRGHLVPIANLVAVIAGFIAGFMWGMQYGESTAKIECIKKSPGYTVIDSERVVNQDGDTIKYQWNKPKMRK